MEGVLVEHLLGLGLLDRHSRHRDGQLHLGRLPPRTPTGPALRLFQLLGELELLDALLDHLDPFRLVHLGAAQELKQDRCF